MPARVLLLAATVALAAVGVAFAHTAAVRVHAVYNRSLGKTLVADSRGHTLYALSPETRRHLLCRGSCRRYWPPVMVRSRTVRLVEGAGIYGRLGIFRRPDGRLQVTLRGFPLYRFSGDRGAGQVRGDGRRSFGGTWEAVPARGAKLIPKPPTG